MTPDATTLITGTSDMELKVWRIHRQTLKTKLVAQVETASVNVNASASASASASVSASGPEDAVDADADAAPPKMELAIEYRGAIARTSKERVVQLLCHPSLPYFACQSADKTIELFKIRDEAELKKKLQRRKKRAKEKKAGAGASTADGDVGAAAESMEKEPELSLADEFQAVRILRLHSRIRSFDFSPSSAATARDDSLHVLVSLINNALEVYSVHPKEPESKLLSSLDRQGHRHDIRTMALSSDDEMLVTAGNGDIKMWNVQTRQCMRTLPTASGSSYAVCSAFVPGNRYILIGTKAGDLDIYDSWSSTLLETVKAHDGTLWSIDIRPDKKGFVTGGADKDVKFWDFAAIEDPEYSATTRRLTVLHMRTLRLSDEVLCVKYSPNQNLVAVSLLDATVKIFFHDTLKFFLSLYGHKVSSITYIHTYIHGGVPPVCVRLVGCLAIHHDDSYPY